MPLLRITVGGCPSDTSPATSSATLSSHRPASSRVSACGLIRRVNRRTPGFRAAEDRGVRRLAGRVDGYGMETTVRPTASRELMAIFLPLAVGLEGRIFRLQLSFDLRLGRYTLYFLGLY